MFCPQLCDQNYTVQGTINHTSCPCLLCVSDCWRLGRKSRRGLWLLLWLIFYGQLVRSVLPPSPWLRQIAASPPTWTTNWTTSQSGYCLPCSVQYHFLKPRIASESHTIPKLYWESVSSLFGSFFLLQLQLFNFKEKEDLTKFIYEHIQCVSI